MSCSLTATCPLDKQDSTSLLRKGILAGLLSSSCCLIQLILNTLSWWNIVHVGCAGFNKILGPPRLYIRAMTIGWLGVLWIHGGKHRIRLLYTTIVTLLLMFLPESLPLMGNITTLHPIVRRTLMRVEDISSWTYETSFIVDNMGCEACESNVKNVLEALVRQANVNWQTGLVKVKNDQEIKLDVLSRQLEHQGYTLHEDLNHFTKRMEADEPQLFQF